jgi:hypothetical protein
VRGVAGRKLLIVFTLLRGWLTSQVTTASESRRGAIAYSAAEDRTNPLLSVNEDPSDAPPNAGAEEAAAATGNEPPASSVPASGAPEQDNKWPDGTRVMVRNKPKSWSEATIWLGQATFIGTDGKGREAPTWPHFFGIL